MHFSQEKPEFTNDPGSKRLLRQVLTLSNMRPYTRIVDLRGVAQLVARGVWDAEVGGSSPLTPTSAQLLCFRLQMAGWRADLECPKF